jgi:hypothetical protein
VVQDTEGNIFGGFTPITWESECKVKCDQSLGSFLFTIKNGHGIPPTIFPIKDDRKDFAIYCYEGYGPAFGFPDASDLRIADNCDRVGARRASYAGSFGDAYANTAQAGGKLGHNGLLAGTPFFAVKEIEVFEVSK